MIRHLTCLTVAAGLAVTVAACATSGSQAAGPPKSKVRVDCSQAIDGAYWLTIAPQPVRQGAQVQVTVWKAGQFPGSETLVPAACMTEWRVSDPGVDIASDGVGLRVSASVKPGTVVEVSGLIGGERRTASFTVIDARAVNLTGTWTEVGSPDCPLTEPPLRELVFTAEGGFKATWTPFETYVDYWGDYRFDPAGLLTLKVTGGNRLPTSADLDGDAKLGDDGLLTLTGIDLGRREGGAPAGCLVFKRR